MCLQMGIQRDVRVEGTLQVVDRDGHYYRILHNTGMVMFFFVGLYIVCMEMTHIFLDFSIYNSFQKTNYFININIFSTTLEK